MKNILNIYVLLIFFLPALLIFFFQFIAKIRSSIFLFKNKDLLFLVILLILFGMLTLILFNKGNFIISNKQLIFMTLVYLMFSLILFYFNKMNIDYLIGLCLGCVAGLVAVNALVDNPNRQTRICLFTFITLVVNIFIYTVYPKSDYMLRHLTDTEQIEAWLSVYKEMKITDEIKAIILLILFILSPVN